MHLPAPSGLGPFADLMAIGLGSNQTRLTRSSNLALAIYGIGQWMGYRRKKCEDEQLHSFTVMFYESCSSHFCVIHHWEQLAAIFVTSISWNVCLESKMKTWASPRVCPGSTPNAKPKKSNVKPWRNLFFLKDSNAIHHHTHWYVSCWLGAQQIKKRKQKNTHARTNSGCASPSKGMTLCLQKAKQEIMRATK